MSRARWPLRLLAAIGLIFVLAYHVDWRALPEQLDRVSWTHALAAFVGLSAQFVLGPWKWRIALAIHHLEFPFSHLLRAYGVGFFFNTFLPSGVGGDAYRVASTWPHEGRRSRAISAVILDRFAGFGALLAAACVAAAPLVTTSRYARTFVIATVCAIAGLAVIVASVRSGGMQRFRESLRRNRFGDALATNFSYLEHAGGRWLPLSVSALLFHTLTIGAVYLLFLGVGSPAPLSVCALAAAAAGLAVIVPISINGLGVVEAAFVGTAVALGEPYGASLAVAVFMRLLVIPQTLAFGLLYSTRHHES